MALNIPTRKSLESISERVKDTKLKVKDLVVPIVVAVILILIAIFFFVPMITKAQEYRSELKQIEEKQKQLDTLIASVNKISDSEMSGDLIDVKSVIPKTLNVSSFIYYIDELAKQKNLEADSISAGDVDLSGGGEETEREGYKGVNAPLSYKGSLENVLSFLDSFYTSSPYIVSPANIKLEKSQSSWEVKLNLTGFYIAEEDETKALNIYKPFKAYNEFPEVIKIFRDKARRLTNPGL